MKASQLKGFRPRSGQSLRIHRTGVVERGNLLSKTSSSVSATFHEESAVQEHEPARQVYQDALNPIDSPPDRAGASRRALGTVGGSSSDVSSSQFFDSDELSSNVSSDDESYGFDEEDLYELPASPPGWRGPEVLSPFRLQFVTHLLKLSVICSVYR